MHLNQKQYLEVTSLSKHTNQLLKGFLRQMESSHIDQLSQQKIQQALKQQNICLKIMTCLEYYQSILQAQRLELKKKKGFRSNEIEREQIDQELMKALEVEIKKICENQIDQDILQQRNFLLQENQKLKIENITLENTFKEIQLKQKEEIYGIMLKIEQNISKITGISQQKNVVDISLSTNNQKKLEQAVEKLINQLQQSQKNERELRSKLQISEKHIFSLKKQLQSFRNRSNQFQKKLEQSKNEVKLVRQRQMQAKRKYLINFFNENIKNVSHQGIKMQTQLEIQKFLMNTRRSLFGGAEVLSDLSNMKQLLISSIQNYTQKSIIKTKLLFKYDQFHKAFGSYLNENSLPFIVIFKLHNKRVCGGFCPGLSSNQPSFLFTSLENGKIFGKNPNFGNQKGCNYCNNILTFGNSELTVTNSTDRQFTFNINTFGPKYFLISKSKQFHEGESDKKIFKFEQMEIHVIIV